MILLASANFIPANDYANTENTSRTDPNTRLPSAGRYAEKRGKITGDVERGVVHSRPSSGTRPPCRIIILFPANRVIRYELLTVFEICTKRRYLFLIDTGK